MTWWPSVPTSAVIAPTMAGSSSTTRMRSGRVVIVIMFLSIVVQTATAAGRATTKRAPCGSARLAPQPGAHGFAEPLRGVQPDPGAARGVGVAPGVRLEDPLAPLLGDARTLVGDAELDDALDEGPVDRDRRVGRGVLDRVLDEVLEDLAESRRVGQGVEPGVGPDVEPVAGEERPDRGQRPRRRRPRRRSG